MNVVFCADRLVLAGLHVAAYSALARYEGDSPLCFHVFTDSLDENDLQALHKTLQRTGKAYALELRFLDATGFMKFPDMNQRWSAYFRLLAIPSLNVPRLLYLDVDTLCGLNIAEVEEIDLKGHPAALLPETLLAKSPDKGLLQVLGSNVTGFYYNSGVIVADVAVWKAQRVTEKCLDYLAHHAADYWDQSALNYALRENCVSLPERFNFVTNERRHWPELVQSDDIQGRLLHFLDYPKPWSFLAEFVHPLYREWAKILRKTFMADYCSYWPPKADQWRISKKQWVGYKKAIKDRILLTGYRQGWLQNVKGVPKTASETGVC